MISRLPDQVANNPLTVFPILSSQAKKSQIAFFDPNLSDLPILLDHLKPGVKAIILKADGTELQQITEILKTKQYHDVHIFSDGEPGEMLLGKTLLTQQNIYNYTSIIEEWGEYLSSRANIVLHGCNIAKSSNVLITILSELTGASITVSNNFTETAHLREERGLDIQIRNIKPPLAIQLFASQYPLLLLSIA